MMLIDIDCPNCGCKIHIEPEQRKGKWILYEEMRGFPDWKCSECGGSGRGDYYYCPWCATAME